MVKRKLRKELMDRRSSISDEYRAELNAKALENFLNSEEYANSKDIFVFVSFGDEIDTHELIKMMLKDNKNVYIPVTYSGSAKMKLSRLTSFDDLEPGHYGILSPKPGCEEFVDHNIVDLVVVPGLAFDRRGHRVGYGAGYYDKFFADLSTTPKKIGFAYDFQILDSLPDDEHDVPVDKIITELT